MVVEKNPRSGLSLPPASPAASPTSSSAMRPETTR